MAYGDLTAGLRERLGVTDAAATDEVLLAALDEALEERADPPAASASSVPQGAIVVDKATFDELQNNAAAGRTAMDSIDKDRRDRVIATALAEGRIAAASKDGWREQLDQDEKGITSLLASFPKNAVPVTEIGHSDTLVSSVDAMYAQAGWADSEETTR